jgi:hypothetical protein
MRALHGHLCTTLLNKQALRHSGCGWLCDGHAARVSCPCRRVLQHMTFQTNTACKRHARAVGSGCSSHNHGTVRLTARCRLSSGCGQSPGWAGLRGIGPREACQCRCCARCHRAAPVAVRARMHECATMVAATLATRCRRVHTRAQGGSSKASARAAVMRSVPPPPAARGVPTWIHTLRCNLSMPANSFCVSIQACGRHTQRRVSQRATQQPPLTLLQRRPQHTSNSHSASRAPPTPRPPTAPAATCGQPPSG